MGVMLVCVSPNGGHVALGFPRSRLWDENSNASEGNRQHRTVTGAEREVGREAGEGRPQGQLFKPAAARSPCTHFCQDNPGARGNRVAQRSPSEG